jgi:hypothetical protein
MSWDAYRACLGVRERAWKTVLTRDVRDPSTELVARHQVGTLPPRALLARPRAPAWRQSIVLIFVLVGRIGWRCACSAGTVSKLPGGDLGGDCSRGAQLLCVGSCACNDLVLVFCVWYVASQCQFGTSQLYQLMSAICTASVHQKKVTTVHRSPGRDLVGDDRSGYIVRGHVRAPTSLSYSDPGMSRPSASVVLSSGISWGVQFAWHLTVSSQGATVLLLAAARIMVRWLSRSSHVQHCALH